MIQVISLIQRPDGHSVVLKGVVYDFHPDYGYCCEVTNPAHLARFREIPEGYQLIGAESPPVVESNTAVLAPQRRTRRFIPPTQAVLIPDGRD